MGDQDPDAIVRQMGLSHEEFLRSLPAAVVGMDCRAEGTRIRISDGERRIEIQLGPEQQRRLGSLSLPQTRVSLILEGYSVEERETFLKRFDLAFQRGGG